MNAATANVLVAWTLLSCGHGCGDSRWAGNMDASTWYKKDPKKEPNCVNYPFRG